MKKTFLTLMLLVGISVVSFGQTKSSGTVTLTTGFTLKVDVDSGANLVTFTMAGPANNWLSIGLNNTSMGSGDCISYNTKLIDQHLCGGQCTPINDTTNNLTLVSANTSGSTKTIVFTRPLSTGDSNDYTFNYNSLNSLNIIWSIGTSNTNQEHGTKSFKTLSFMTLGVDSFSSLENNVKVYPNPSKGVFTINTGNSSLVSNMKVFDMNARLIKTIQINSADEINSIDLSELSKGTYFLELSNNSDKTVKKIQIN